MKLFSVLALAVALVGGLAAQQVAEVPATREDVVRLFDTLHLKDQVTNTMKLVSEQIKQGMRESIRNRHPEVTEEDFARIDKISEGIMKDYPVDQMLETTIPIYQKHLSKGDVDAMLAFYMSPTGQKLLREQPAIAAESMQAMSTTMQKAMADAMERVEKMLRDEQPKSTPKAAPAPKQKS